MTNDKQKMNDQIRDHTKMSEIVLLLQLIKTFRLVFIMISFSYFSGLLWFVICDYSSDGNGFIEENEFNQNQTTFYSRISALTYFAFTTLSTVGLGDFHPKSSTERIFCSFFMLFGVMFTSLVMDNFGNMIDELRNFNKSYEDSEHFNLFLGTLRKLNGDDPLPR